jgi:plastocyanin
MRSKVATGIAVLALVAACSGGESPAGTWLYGPTLAPSTASAAPSAAGTEGPASPAASTPAASPGGDPSQVTIGTDAGSELLFDPETVTVAGGGSIEISFENRSILPHNLTFQAPIDAATAPVVEPGAGETITFEAPAAGDYPFVCTLHPGMDGVLTVEGP